MKKFFAILTVLSFVSVAVLSQNEQSSEPAGKYSVEANFNPAAIFDANAGAMFAMPTFKLRIFNSENTAYRMRFYFDVLNEKDKIGLDGNYQLYSDFEIMLAPGYEKHIGKGRLKPYYGFEVPIIVRTTKTETKIGDTTFESKNPYNVDYVSFGVNAVFGLDFYLYKGLYIGAEFTPGFAYRILSDQKEDGETTSKGGNRFALSTYSASGLKLGFRF